MARLMNWGYGSFSVYRPKPILIEISQYDAGLTNLTFAGSAMWFRAATLSSQSPSTNQSHA